MTKKAMNTLMLMMTITKDDKVDNHKNDDDIEMMMKMIFDHNHGDSLSFTSQKAREVGANIQFM